MRDPDHGYPYNATPIDLAKQGYVEEEFLLQGNASRYNTPAGATGSIVDSGHPYQTRIVVRRPDVVAVQRHRGGRSVMVSRATTATPARFQSMDHLVRAGYAWVGVSNQAVGVNALKEWSPKRYGALDVSDHGTVMGDGLSYDIFTAAALAIRGKGSRDVLGGLTAARLVAVGHSQSAGRLYTYFHSVHPLVAPAYDGVILHGGGGQVRGDLNVKVFKFLDETDVPGQVNGRQPDTDRFRQWEIAGTSHLTAQFSRALAGIGLRVSGMTPVEGSPSIEGPTISGGIAGNGAAGNGAGDANTGPNGGCEKPPFSRVPSHYAMNAAFNHMARWIKMAARHRPPRPVEVKDAALEPANAPAAGRTAGAGEGRRGGRGRSAVGTESGWWPATSSETASAASDCRNTPYRPRQTPASMPVARRAASVTAG